MNKTTAPDFDKKTIDTIAKRAGFICSNPDCKVKTVGPNTEPKKSTTIGEAAHILGARPSSKRYKIDMTDMLRSEITNAIWLCRNCHKKIDSDDGNYTSDLLFRWRELHEKNILSELGTQGDKIQDELQDSILQPFRDYPFIIKRVIIDRPSGWEYRLTSELMRFLNKSHFRRLKDLQDNLYLKQRKHIIETEVISWIHSCTQEMTFLLPPLVNLFQKLNLSWGPPGQSGDIEEIHHTCLLIRDYIAQIVQFEEQLHFTVVPEQYENLQQLLKNKVSSQILKIEELPRKLDNIVALMNARELEGNEEPLTINETITFELPEDWNDAFASELQRLREIM